MSNFTIQDYENQIKLLITQEEWKKAYALANQVLRVLPDNQKIQKLKNKIEKTVKEINRKSIKEELKLLQPLLENQEYELYLQKIGPLQAYITDFPEIKELILKASNLLNQKYQQQKVEFLNQKIKESNELLKEKKFKEAINLLESLNKSIPSNLEIKNLLQKAKNDFITNQLKINQGLIESAKFEDIILFLLKLQNINPKSSKIENLISKTKKRYKDHKIESKKDYIFKTLEEIKVLSIKKKYDQAFQLNKKVLSIDSENQQALKNRIKLQQKINNLCNKETTKQIYKYFSNNLKDYQKDPKKYIKI